MDILDGLKKDIEAGIKQGVDAVKSTAAIVREKAEELSEKGKTQYYIYELKNKKQKQSAAVGEKLRQLVKTKKMKISNPDLKKLLSAVDKTDAALAKLEGKGAPAAPVKEPAKKKPAIKKPKMPAKKAATSAVPEKKSN